MGGILGGGGGGGLLGGGGGSGGGGFLGNLLGGLPDPLGLGKMLFGFGEDKGQDPSMGQGGGAPPPPGMKFMGPQSGVSQNPGQMYSSPMGPTGFGIGGGGKR